MSKHETRHIFPEDKDNKEDLKVNIDFESLKEKLRELREKEFMSKVEVIARVGALDEFIEFSASNKEEIDEIKKGLISHIYSKAFESDPDLKDYYEEAVNFDEIEKFKSRGLKVNLTEVSGDDPISGEYSIGNGAKIKIAHSGFMMALAELGATGENHFSSIMGHEIVHGFQTPNKKILEFVKKIKNQASFKQAKEAQAYTSTSRLGERMSDNSLYHLIEFLRKEKGREKKKEINNLKDIDYFASAAQDIRRLRVLGIKEKDIAILIRKCDYDELSVGFPVLSQKVAGLAKTKKLELEDLDLMVDAQRIQQEITVLTIKAVAQEIIKELTDDFPEELKFWKDKKRMRDMEEELEKGRF